ncbi:hypothetical protein J6590_069242 [Homalodisca vitripennis]|nr:hypothetical protein J6590_069242 [Homalodisca vitripennis]
MMRMMMMTYQKLHYLHHPHLATTTNFYVFLLRALNEAFILPANTPNKRKRTSKYDKVGKTIIKYLDRKKTSSSAKSEQLDTDPRKEALKVFLLTFLSDLTKIDDGEVRQLKKILDAVDDMIFARSRCTHPSSSACLSLSNDSFTNQVWVYPKISGYSSSSSKVIIQNYSFLIIRLFRYCTTDIDDDTERTVDFGFC